MNCKAIWCKIFGHDWTDKLRVELDFPLYGRGFVVHESCSRCSKTRSYLDFKLNRASFKSKSTLNGTLEEDVNEQTITTIEEYASEPFLKEGNGRTKKTGKHFAKKEASAKKPSTSHKN